MEQYISKSALLAEIDRREIGYNVDCKHSVEYDTTRKILNIIDTLEVKEVDLEKEFEWFLDEAEGVPRMWHSDEQIEWAKDIAKHFFELGMSVSNKVQKGKELASEGLEKAEKFIDEHTKYCSNLAHYEELNGNVWEENTPWLTPDQARKAVEIAREEVIEQMMAKAVDGEVTYGKSLAIPSLGWVVDKERLDYGDKVKLIIIKKIEL